MLMGSHVMRPQTCLAYSSSIQGSSSPHQRVEREAMELLLSGCCWAMEGWGCLRKSVSRSGGLEEGKTAGMLCDTAGSGGGDGRRLWWLEKERKGEGALG